MEIPSQNSTPQDPIYPTSIDAEKTHLLPLTDSPEISYQKYIIGALAYPMVVSLGFFFTSLIIANSQSCNKIAIVTFNATALAVNILAFGSFIILNFRNSFSKEDQKRNCCMGSVGYLFSNALPIIGLTLLTKICEDY